MSNLYDEIRQGTIIQTTGPGAMTILQKGVSVMIPGLDAWYIGANGRQDIPDESILLDANLASALGVEYFIQPPALGVAEQKHSEYLNVFVFPRWAVCYAKGCRNLVQMGNSDTKRPYCPKCLEKTNKKSETIQVNFVIACEDGHLDEFPWIQWVHKSVDTSCSNPVLTLKSRGSGQLSGQSITCICGAKRTLAGTSEATEMNLGGDKSERTTYLTKNLDKNGHHFLCKGSKPWLRQEGSGCGLPVRMILRSSNNIYYGAVESSILVPSVVGELAELVELLRTDPKIGTIRAKLLRHAYDYTKVAEMVLVVIQEQRYEGVSKEDMAAALEAAEPKPSFGTTDVETNAGVPELGYDRSHEFEALTTVRESEDLVVRDTAYVNGDIPGLHRINAVARLKETRALKGFSRIKPILIDTETGRNQFRRKSRGPGTNWLPAIRNVGEGIFISLDMQYVNSWEEQAGLNTRVSTIEERLTLNGISDPNRPMTPRRVLLHTLAHVLIQELVIECGYTAASLKERIYASGDQAGLLIYTASPDADGTMGGLVEMADSKIFKRVLEAALQGASWCSNDPVCMELGVHGQGPYGANLSACHSCSLLPETACEMFNLGLDRAVLVGDTLNPGHFNPFFPNS
jgi:hypothetical protein